MNKPKRSSSSSSATSGPGAGAGDLPEVTISEHAGVRYLHLGTEWVQGSMRVADPFAIDLEYTQRMMAWLLFLDPASVAGRQAMQLGLGAGSLTKFCHNRLRMRTLAVELNPRVILACRMRFNLPPDDERLTVLQGDAAQVASTSPPGWVDALQVDLYDEEAAAPVLDSEAFYADCRHLLTDEGSMVVNLFGRSSSFERSLEKIVGAFGASSVWAFRPTREGNTIVLARRTADRPARDQLLARAETVQARWGLPANKWLKVFRPVA